MFPLALEVTVEATFPADQATVTCFIFFSSSVQGVFLMVVENWLGYPLPPEFEVLVRIIKPKSFIVLYCRILRNVR